MAQVPLAWCGPHWQRPRRSGWSICTHHDRLIASCRMPRCVGCAAPGAAGFPKPARFRARRVAQLQRMERSQHRAHAEITAAGSRSSPNMVAVGCRSSACSRGDLHLRGCVNVPVLAGLRVQHLFAHTYLAIIHPV